MVRGRFWPLAFGVVIGGLRASVFRHARHDQPDLIISTHVNFSPVATVREKFSSARFAVVGHGIDVWKIHKASIRVLPSGADQLLAVSDFTRRRMAEELGVEAESIELLPNTFDDGRFDPGLKPAEFLQRYQLG